MSARVRNCMQPIVSHGAKCQEPATHSVAGYYRMNRKRDLLLCAQHAEEFNRSHSSYDGRAEPVAKEASAP